MRTGSSTTAFVIAGFFVLTLAMTWPIGRFWSVAVPDVDDAYFSVWRISWIAHQLPSDPLRLFDANMFYPERGTLAFSDAMLLVGVLGAPLLWLGADPALVHNLLLILAVFTSAVATYFLGRRLGASTLGAVVAGMVFAFAPYRISHIGHLELQWTVWMPLAMIALHRLAANPTAFNGVLLGACIAAQTFCSIYYGAFLSLYVTVASIIVWWRHASRQQLLKAMSAAVVPLAIVLLIYAPPYARTRSTYGARAGNEQQRYSASLGDFSKVPPLNRLRGRDSIASDELSLYPGIVPIAMAAAALAPPVSAAAWLYGVTGVVAFEAALGTRGHVFPLAQQLMPVLSSLRSPARFGVLVLLSLAMLAAIGVTRIEARWPRLRAPLAGILIAVCLIEYWSSPLTVRPILQPTDAHRFLAQQPPGSAVLELPVPSLEALWLYETTYQMRSIYHWQPLVNGYSAFAPKRYRETLEALATFPDQSSIDYLQRLGVRFVLINRERYREEEFNALTRQLAEQPQFLPARIFGPDDREIFVAELKATN